MTAAGRALALCLGLALAGPAIAAEPAGNQPWDTHPPDSIRVATFDAALSRRGAGLLVKEMAAGSLRIDAVAEIILRVRPDILLVNEFDRDSAHRALERFAARLRAGMAGLAGIDYGFVYQGPVNTGVPSGFDLDHDGRHGGPEDALGFGRFPGQYAMAVLSRLSIDFDRLRTFRNFRWSTLPGADRPAAPDGSPYWTDVVWQALPLPSKSLWDVPVRLPGGKLLHLIASHPTPPVFDGPEDRNGRRNGDEIKLIAALIDGAPWLADDHGRKGGLRPGDLFVVAGDLNADPADGDGRHMAIRALLADPRLQDPRPASAGAPEAAAMQGGANAGQSGNPALDTADWRERPGPGNMRVDYVLPSAGLKVRGAGVFWPRTDSPLSRLVGGGRPPVSSDHRLVWVDVSAN